MQKGVVRAIANKTLDIVILYCRKKYITNGVVRHSRVTHTTPKVIILTVTVVFYHRQVSLYSIQINRICIALLSNGHFYIFQPHRNL